jgi:hypothetical protein
MFFRHFSELTLILLVILIPASLILALCVYKVYQWYKTEQVNVNSVLFQFKAQQEEHKKNRLYIKARQARNCVFLIGFSLWFLFTLAGLLYPLDRDITGWGLFGIIALTILTSNIIVLRLWRCPFCKTALPGKINRAGRRPVFIETCPACTQNLLKK